MTRAERHDLLGEKGSELPCRAEREDGFSHDEVIQQFHVAQGQCVVDVAGYRSI